MIKHLQVETTNICNASCIFCPHDKYNKFGVMADGLYRKIVEDAAQYNLISFTPILTGEPFCDPGIMSKIKLARELMPKTMIKLFTNGSLMTFEQIDELASLGDVEINISLNGQDKWRRQEMMGLDDFDEVLGKINYISNLGIGYGVSAVWHPVYSIEQINKFLKITGSYFIRFQSFCGDIYPYRRVFSTRCLRVTEYLTVMWTGQVNLCCFDPFGKVFFGDLNRQTLREIWDGDAHRKYLEAHDNWHGEKMELCNRCTEGA